MDKIAVCAIFKDEAPYLLEWIAFHKMVGVDLFVLYDNGGRPQFKCPRAICSPCRAFFRARPAG